MAEFDPKKLNEIAKFFSKTEKRYINVRLYTYDGGEKKISLTPKTKNSNENCDEKKKWITTKGISGITIQEAKDLVIALEKAISKA